VPLALAPDSLVVLVGASGSGKSWWAHGFFRDTQVVSSDRCRALVSDDEENQGVNREAFAVFYAIIRQRLALGRLTVADSTGLQEFARRRLLHLARGSGRPAHLVVFEAPLEVLLRQNAGRSRRVPEEVLTRHAEQLRALLEGGALEAEGFDAVHRLAHPFGREAAPVIVRPAPPDPAPTQ
jgi:predicted kinase